MFGIHKPGADDAATDTKHSNHIMIWLTVGVLLVGLLALRASKAGKATPSLGYAGNTNTGSTGSGDGVGGGFADINKQLAGFNQALGDAAAQEQSDNAALDAEIQTQGTWVTNLTDQLKSAQDTIAKLGQQTASNTTITNSLSQASPSGPVGLSQSLIDQLHAGGEYITGQTKSTTGGDLFLTNKGGVYTSEGANFFGSYLGYANKTSNPGAEMAGHGDFSHGSIQALANGFYSETNNNGETYTFNQDTKAKGY